VIQLRRSFLAKLLMALAGSIGLLLIVTVVVVQVVTRQQVAAATAHTVDLAARLFEERSDYDREVLARMAAPFTETRRAVSALDDAIKSGDLDFFTDNTLYELDLRGMTEEMLVFTDDVGAPVLTIQGGEVRPGDPAGVQSLAEGLLETNALFEIAYRELGGVLYNAETIVLELNGRLVGTVTIGMPIEDQKLSGLGESGDFEACLVIGEGCVVRTELVEGELEAAMLSARLATEPVRVTIDGAPWSVQSSALLSDRPQDGYRIVAVPLAPVLDPFRRIMNALILGGLGAMAIALILGTALSRNLTRPVRALVAATDRVAEGDYTVEVSIDSLDEIGTLAGAFNEMTKGLQAREQYRSVLNKVVSRDIAAELMKGEVELGGENRHVTVLFADIRGFTTLTEGMEPQAVIGLLNELMEHLATAVDAEDGVVDKFIGDEVMAVFGAPVRQPDHALRAVSAALRMRDGIAQLNAGRAEKGLLPVGVGIGIATGVAVAGNMGSADRLNYTVLGATVNLAARLTSAAKAGEILVSDATRTAAGIACRTTPRGEVTLKGFSTPVDVFEVDGIDRSVTRSQPTAVHQALRLGAVVSLALGLSVASSLVSAAPVSAQWPTLRDAGMGYLSDDGKYQIDLSGQMDLEAFYFSAEEDALSGLAYGSGPLFAPRVRLFLDVFLGDHVYGLVEWRGDRGEAPTADFWEARVEQAYLSVGNTSGSFQLQGGIFPSPFGAYAKRHLTIVDPFLRPPLMYDHRTVISRRWAPRNADWFSRWRDNPDEWRRDGAPPVWGVPYQWGGMASVRLGFLSGKVAAMNSAPSSEPLDWYEFEVVEELSWIGRLEATVSPELTLGLSFNEGPYVRNDVSNAPEFPLSGTTYDQTLWAFDAALARGPFMFRGEVIHDSWDVPNINEEIVDIGYSVEAQVDVATGWSLAARYGAIDFREIRDSGDWDWDTRRLEASVGYRITRNAGLLLAWGMNWDGGPLDPDDDLAGIKLWWAF
jgi:class 3 adenylate cyclase